MPLYDYICDTCNKYETRYLPIIHEKPMCCNSVMRRVYNIDVLKIKWHYPSWVDRIDDIHKAQEQRGERLRFVHPSEVL